MQKLLVYYDPLQDYVDIKHQVIRDGIIKLFTFTAISSDENYIGMKRLQLKRKKKLNNLITNEINNTNEEINRQNIR